MALTQISTQGIKDGTITNADINASAAIAGSKISPAFSANITTTGNAVIGGTTINTSQDKALSIFGTNGSELKLQSTNFGGTAADGGAALTCSFGSLFLTNNNANGDIHFQTKVSGQSTSEKMRLTEAGNLGIGTTSPDRTIHCHNSSNTTNVRAKFSNGTTGQGASDGFEIGINASDPAQAVLVNYENSPMAFFTNASERMRIDSSGRVLVGHSTARDNIAGINDPQIQLEGLSSDDSSFSLIRNTDNAFGGSIVLGKTRGGSVGSNTAVQNGDDIGNIRFAAADGTDIDCEVANIKAEIDGTPGSNDTPGRLSFLTTADGATNATERMRIDSSGNVGIGTTSPQSALHIGASGGDDNNSIRLDGTNNTAGGQVHRFVIENRGESALVNFKTSAANATETTKVSIQSITGNVTMSGSLLINNSNGVNVFSSISMTETSSYGFITSFSGKGIFLRPTSNGVYLDAGDTSFSSGSDERSKTDLTPISDALSKINNCRSVIGRYKTDDISVKRSFLIAQDFQSNFPEAVSVDKNTTEEGNLGLRYQDVIPLLLAGIKELSTKIDVLETEVATLKAA